MDDHEIKVRFTVLTWAIGLLAALIIAMLGNLFAILNNLITLSHELGQINGQLALLINHVALK